MSKVSSHLGANERLGEPDHDLAMTHPVEVRSRVISGGPCRSDLQDEIGRGEQGVAVRLDARALVAKRIVGEPGGHTGACFDNDVETSLREVGDGRRNDRDAILGGRGLSGNSDDHALYGWRIMRPAGIVPQGALRRGGA